MRILVAGGAGFVGSHVCKEIDARGWEPICYDNLSTGHRELVRWGPLVEGDIRDRERLSWALKHHAPAALVHLAAHAYVGESVIEPAKYYSNNVQGTIALVEACRDVGVTNIVFSSSCAVYGRPRQLPITEDAALQPVSPYGRSKLLAEWMLADYEAAYRVRHVALRYFNAAGADPNGEAWEHHDPETHLIPRALLAAAGVGPALDVFGNDYETSDGTCVRDYVHVSDLAEAHLAAVEHLLDGGPGGCFNLGSGSGHSIGEVLAAIERITGLPVPTVSRARRPGDPPALVADFSRAATKLGFKPRRSNLDTIIRTAAPTFGIHPSMPVQKVSGQQRLST
jgi:UDP-arabinose 4-epimerase